MKIALLFILLIIAYQNKSISQYAVSITINDLPNTKQYIEDDFRSLLLTKPDSMKIPTNIDEPDKFQDVLIKKVLKEHLSN